MKAHNKNDLLVTLTINDLEKLISLIIKNEMPKPSTLEKLPELMSRKEVVEYFNISYVTLQTWIKNKVIARPIKKMNRVYFKTTDILYSMKNKYYER